MTILSRRFRLNAKPPLTKPAKKRSSEPRNGPGKDRWTSTDEGVGEEGVGRVKVRRVRDPAYKDGRWTIP
jgi:hypothetical protein